MFINVQPIVITDPSEGDVAGDPELQDFYHFLLSVCSWFFQEHANIELVQGDLVQFTSSEYVMLDDEVEVFELFTRELTPGERYPRVPARTLKIYFPLLLPDDIPMSEEVQHRVDPFGDSSAIVYGYDASVVDLIERMVLCIGTNLGLLEDMETVLSMGDSETQILRSTAMELGVGYYLPEIKLLGKRGSILDARFEGFTEGHRYGIEVSNDLKNWNNIWLGTPGENMDWFEDFGNSKRGFVRVVGVPSDPEPE